MFSGFRMQNGFLGALRITCVPALSFLFAAIAFGKPALTELKVFPADVNLKTRYEHQSIVVQAVYEDGVTRDVTAQAGYTFGNKALIKFEQFNLSPVADGQTE